MNVKNTTLKPRSSILAASSVFLASFWHVLCCPPSHLTRSLSLRSGVETETYEVELCKN